MTPFLENYYNILVMNFYPSGLVARLPLVVVLYLVATGNVTPGHRLLSGIFAAHFGVGWLLAVGSGGQVSALAYVCLALMGVCAWVTFQDNTPWRALPESNFGRKVVLLGYALAFVYPFWKFLSWWATPFFSPMGILPHQSLLVLLILIAVTGRAVPEALLWITAAAAVAIAALDAVYLGRYTTLILPVMAVVSVAIYFLPERIARTADVPPPGKKELPKPPVKSEPPSVKPSEKPAPKAGRKWDIK